MATVLGVDGWREGWIGALVAHHRIRWLRLAGAAEVVAVQADAVGIDIPIGLPDTGTRRCDLEARARLGPRAASVFPAPVRAVLQQSTYAGARRLLAGRGGPSMSAQSWALVPRVRDVDSVMSPARQARIVEVHPEMSFRLLAGRDLPAKRTVPGAAARIAALHGWRADVLSALERLPPGPALDDALDALVAAWSAQRWAAGTAEVLGGETDGRDLRMQIVC